MLKHYTPSTDLPREIHITAQDHWKYEHEGRNISTAFLDLLQP